MVKYGTAGNVYSTMLLAAHKSGTTEAAHTTKAYYYCAPPFASKYARRRNGKAEA